MRISASGPVGVGTAWRRYDELGLWKTWSPQIRKVESVATRLAPGVRGKVLGPPGIAVTFEVLEVDQEARTWVWKVGRGPFRVVLHHGVEATPEGSSTWLELNPLLVAYAAPAWFALHRLVTMPG